MMDHSTDLRLSLRRDVNIHFAVLNLFQTVTQFRNGIHDLSDEISGKIPRQRKDQCRHQQNDLGDLKEILHQLQGLDMTLDIPGSIFQFQRSAHTGITESVLDFRFFRPENRSSVFVHDLHDPQFVILPIIVTVVIADGIPGIGGLIQHYHFHTLGSVDHHIGRQGIDQYQLVLPTTQIQVTSPDGLIGAYFYGIGLP